MALINHGDGIIAIPNKVIGVHRRDPEARKLLGRANRRRGARLALGILIIEGLWMTHLGAVQVQGLSHAAHCHAGTQNGKEDSSHEK